MVTSGIVINQYPDQSYKTIFNRQSGLLLRLEDTPGKEPFWCSYGPELLDISITNMCDKGCPHCYKRSIKTGKHLSIKNYQIILRQAAEMKVLQKNASSGISDPLKGTGFI